MRTVIALLAALLLLGFAQESGMPMPANALVLLAAPLPGADKPENALVLLEKKLHGEWEGGPCMGDWTFEANGRFVLKNYSPGGNTFTGGWKVRWDALPPTLVLTFKTSNAPLHFQVGETREVKLTH